MTRNVDPFVLLADVMEARQAPWRRRAACAGLPTAWFYPEQGGPTGEALNVCRQCPVRAECAEDGRLETAGIWGGESNRTRKEHRNGRPGPLPISHGTPGGYRTHRRRGEDACQACLDAHAADRAQRKGGDPYPRTPDVVQIEMVGMRRRWQIPA